MSKEYILCAANYYDDGQKWDHQPFNIETGYVICGHRHHNCFAVPYVLFNKDVDKCPEDTTQGFLTNTNRFVDRVEARQIALDAGQLSGRKVHGRTRLFSEDIY